MLASKHPAVAVGETLFGYFPMATHLVIEAADVSKRGLRDGAAHRQEVSPVYNAYARFSGDPTYAGEQGDFRALMLPLTNASQLPVGGVKLTLRLVASMSCHVPPLLPLSWYCAGLDLFHCAI